MSLQKRQSIDLEAKYKIIKLVEEKKSYESVYPLFPDINCYDISKIMKSKDKYIGEYESTTSG